MNIFTRATFALLLVSTINTAVALDVDIYSESTADTKSDNAAMFNRLHVNFARTQILNKPAQLYGGTGFSTDDRSASQSVYNDNYAYVTAGGRWSLLPYVSAFVEMREVISEPEYAKEKSNHDGRAGAFFYYRQDIGGSPLFHEHYGELVYSNRQQSNTFGMERSRAGLSKVLTNTFTAESMLESQLRVDRLGNYYDNRIDLGPKARLKVNLGRFSLDLNGGYMRGLYLGRSAADPLPQKKSYGNWQALLALYGGF
jgi:hypothetical protein